jgi:pSer/pThr/pTyr-binding forkhead associated (FHA) protein/predicted  nucleic acid-binding Zn-ribbon protein
MAIDKSQSQEIDLDRTDRLPILQGVSIDEDVADDSVRLDYAVSGPSAGTGPVPLSTSHSQASDFTRSGMDLPSLAESVRSVEERIARQTADYEALNRLYEKACDAQLAAGTRADALASELSTAQSALAVEQHRSREMQRALSEGTSAAAASRARAEESSREAERYQSEARTLRDALIARDATIAQVLHSLGERDAQLFALQREHAQTVPMLEERSRARAQLEADLRAARTQGETLSLEVRESRVAISSLTEKLAREESDLTVARRDLSTAKAQATSHLELLRTREWRGGFNQNLFREWDDKVDAARSGHGALQAECDRLSQSVVLLTAKLAEQEGVISKLHAGGAAEAAALSKKAHELQEAQRTCTELHSRIDRLEGERKQLQGELGARGDELAAVRTANADELAAVRTASADELAAIRTANAGELQRARDSQTAAEARLAELSAELEGLRAEAVTHEEEMTVLMAHLNEARRPIQSIQADVKRLNEEAALKSLSIDQLTEENRTLRTTLERTRGALEERELLIRRLERSASNNANVLGRLQTSIERLGNAAPAQAPLAGEFLAELIKIEGDTRTAYPLGRRTRIGRAPGCELQIDAQSVSRHHAMLLKGNREVIIEDLNSTNGVLVNGRKVTRHVLSDGDLLTIGETNFQCRLRPSSRASENPQDPAIVGVHASSGPAPAAAQPTTDSGSSEPSNPTDSRVGS